MLEDTGAHLYKILKETKRCELRNVYTHLGYFFMDKGYGPII